MRVSVNFADIETKELVKELKDNERLCPVCKGLGYLVSDADDSSDINNKRSINQVLMPCNHCIQGIQKVCKYCGKPFDNQVNCECDCELYIKEKEDNAIIARKEKIDRAEEIQISDVNTMLYCEENNKKYNNIQEFLDSLVTESGFKTRPEVLWVCDKLKINLDAYDILDNAIEYPFDYIAVTQHEFLQAILNAWCDKQVSDFKIEVPNYEKYVRINWNEYYG